MYYRYMYKHGCGGKNVPEERERNKGKHANERTNKIKMAAGKK